MPGSQNHDLCSSAPPVPLRPHCVPPPHPHAARQTSLSLTTRSFKLYLHPATSFLRCPLSFQFETCFPRSRPSLPFHLFSSFAVTPALSHWLLLLFLRSARIWVNRCSVVSIFIAFFKFRSSTHHTAHPISHMCTPPLHVLLCT